MFHQSVVMKKAGCIILLSIVAVVTGCLKQDNSANNGVNINLPHGTFLGQFTLIHKSSKTGNLDTSSATVSLVLSGANFTVGGDTTKIQAPSYGTFTVDGNLITFMDVTVTKRTPANTPKKHLNGPFLFNSTGSTLQIRGASDTLSYAYDLNSF